MNSAVKPYQIVLAATTGALVAIGVYNKFTRGKCTIETDLSGKTVLITGANGGIGKETAKQLSKLGANIIMAGRKGTKTDEALQEIISFSHNNQITAMELDLADSSSILHFTRKIKEMNIPIHILINNAGVMNYVYETTKDGYESNIGVNHLGHFLLTLELLPILIANKARIINLSSEMHQSYLRKDLNTSAWTSNSLPAYMLYPRSKLVNVLFTKELNRRYGGQGITAVAVAPGFVNTDIGRKHPGFVRMFTILKTPPISWLGFCRTPEEGAQTSIFCAVSSYVEGGKYYLECKERKSSAPANDEELARKIWEESERLVYKV